MSLLPTLPCTLGQELWLGFETELVFALWPGTGVAELRYESKMRPIFWPLRFIFDGIATMEGEGSTERGERGEGRAVSLFSPEF